MNSARALLVLRFGLSAASAALLLVGASLNGSGRLGWAMALAVVASAVALGAGVVYRNWRLSIPVAAAAAIFTVLIAQFNPRQGDLVLQLLGLALLVGAGAVGGGTVRNLLGTIDRQSTELQLKQRAFLAATSDVVEGAAPAGDVATLTASLAGQLGADLACCYFASGDQSQFVPQSPGIGLDGLHLMTLSRHANGTSALLSAIESGQTYVAAGNGALKELFNYMPEDLQVRSAMAVPMPIGERIGGFILLCSNRAGFSDRDRRLAMTLTHRPGSRLADAHAVRPS